MVYLYYFITKNFQIHGVSKKATDKKPRSVAGFDKATILNLLRIKEGKKCVKGMIEDFRTLIFKNPRGTHKGFSTTHVDGSKGILEICKGTTI